MTDMYTESQGSKKKYLIPLVVLLLCAVSLTGAGYAYNSQVNGTGEISDADYVVINFSGSEYDAATGKYTATAALTFNTVTSGATTTWTADSTVTIMTIKVVYDSKDKTEDASKLTTAPVVTLSKYANLPSGITLNVGAASGNANEGFTYAITASGSTTTAPALTSAVTFDINATSPTFTS